MDRLEALKNGHYCNYYGDEHQYQYGAIGVCETCWLIRQVGELQQWVNDLQSEMYINCVYCGHRYGPNPGTPVAMADVLKKHIEQCPKHPVSELKQENARLRERLNRALADLHHHHGCDPKCESEYHP